jgi:hypothetical protein
MIFKIQHVCAFVSSALIRGCGTPPASELLHKHTPHHVRHLLYPLTLKLGRVDGGHHPKLNTSAGAYHKAVGRKSLVRARYDNGENRPAEKKENERETRCINITSEAAVMTMGRIGLRKRRRMKENGNSDKVCISITSEAAAMD